MKPYGMIIEGGRAQCQPGGAERVIVLLATHSLSRGGGTAFASLYSQVVKTLATKFARQTGREPLKMAPAQALVQTYVITGVIRNYAVADTHRRGQRLKKRGPARLLASISDLRIADVKVARLLCT